MVDAEARVRLVPGPGWFNDARGCEAWLVEFIDVEREVPREIEAVAVSQPLREGREGRIEEGQRIRRHGEHTPLALIARASSTAGLQGNSPHPRQ